MYSLPFQNNTFLSAGPNHDKTANVLNIQPVLPFSLGEWNVRHKAKGCGVVAFSRHLGSLDEHDSTLAATVFEFQHHAGNRAVAAWSLAVLPAEHRPLLRRTRIAVVNGFTIARSPRKDRRRAAPECYARPRPPWQRRAPFLGKLP